jgi:hypothetical protein
MNEEKSVNERRFSRVLSDKHKKNIGGFLPAIKERASTYYVFSSIQAPMPAPLTLCLRP